MSDEHPADKLDPRIFDQYATYAAHMLDNYGFAYVELCPGDGTRYQMSIIVPPTIRQDRDHLHLGTKPDFITNERYFVACQLGPLYQWHPLDANHRPLTFHWTYVHEKFVYGNSGPSEWTARVLTRYLDTLAVKLSERIEARADTDTDTDKD